MAEIRRPSDVPVAAHLRYLAPLSPCWRLGLEPSLHAPARLSHAIRKRTSEQAPIVVTSTNVDEFVQQPLPGVEKQLENVVEWLASELADDPLGRIPNPWPNMIAGIVGAVDEKRVQRLLRYAKDRGVLELDDNEALIGLTPEGWKWVHSGLQIGCRQNGCQ